MIYKINMNKNFFFKKYELIYKLLEFPSIIIN